MAEPDDALARREAENVLHQFDFVLGTIESSFASGRRFELTPALVSQMNRLALDGLDPRAGELRTGRMIITNSEHRPPDPDAISGLLDDMCDYVTEHWKACTAVHLAAYVMWRLNWIHPYWDGNGRTSRAAGYLVLSTRLGYVLPGTETVPAMIARNKRNYHEALEDADRVWRVGRLDLSRMERLVARYLERQLRSGLPQDRDQPQ